MLPAHFFLLISDTRLGIWRRQGRQLRELAHLNTDPDGFAALTACLSGQPRARWLILCDLPDEQCRLDNMPALGRADRRDWLARRLAQHFPDATQRCALPVRGSDPARPVLLAALGHHPLLDRCLQLLTQYRARLAGIHSPALLLAELAPHWPGLPAHTLLICPQHDGRLRHAYLAQQQLQLVRQSQHHTDGAAALLQHLADEAEQTRQFLVRQHKLDPAQQLSIVLLCADHAYPALLALAPAHCQPLALTQWAGQLGLDSHGAPDSADALWLALLAQSPPAHQYARPEQRRLERTARLGRHLLGLALALLLASGCLALHLQQQARQLDAASRQLAQTRQQLRQANAAVLASQPDPSQPGQLLTRYLRELANWPKPARDLRQAGNALHSQPAFQAEEIHWQAQASARSPAPRRLQLRGQLSGPPAADAQLRLALSRQLGATTPPESIAAPQALLLDSQAGPALAQPFSVDLGLADRTP